VASTADNPRVSVAIPAYNAARWIREAIDSALNQTFADLEIVVVEDASSDETLEVVAAIEDPRLRLFANPVNLGHSGNWNRVVSLCRAPFVKFLCGDDVLREDCIEKMVARFERSDDVGLVFSRRVISVASEDVAQEWQSAYAMRHLSFGQLADVNDGRWMFETYLASGFDDNWIGEPTNVMMRRTLLERLPGFHPQIRQAADMDLWVRALFHGDVGFVDEPLATYRAVTEGSMTEENFHDQRLWLDRLWMLESLLADEGIRAAYPELKGLARRERLRCVARLGRAVLRRSRVGDRLGEVGAVLAYERRGIEAVSPPSMPASVPVPTGA
jgi:glycosyltransferase involved in cell wall biosynthesis